jgi:hypothetical protein
MKKTSWKKRLFSWGLAVVALAFVAYVVPIRDRCEDPAAPRTTRVAVSREADGACILHIPSGAVKIPKEQCESLSCEPGLATTFKRVKPAWVAAMLAVYVLGYIAWAVRWRLLLSLAGVKMSVWRVTRVSFEAQAAGILLPGGLGGDALRIAAVLGAPREGGGTTPGSIVVASVLLDRVIGLVTIASMAAVLGLAMGGKEAGAVSYILASFPLALLVGVAILRSRFLSRLRFLTEGRLAKFARPILEYIGDPRAPRTIVYGLCMSLVVSAIQLGIIRGLVAALDATPASERWIFVGSAMSMIVSAVPALPGGWGTGDAAYVFFLGKMAGLGAGVALAVCLLYRLFWYFTGIIGALLHLSGGRKDREG